ncbi:hypothetical protein [Halorientalis pallida]|uniref:Uncharacterized protein n=1 Tax=Halorientalis pallida TaxID=2479928 RepID=A0A498KZA3_9EURY|nr:hypothetical protein [Halorientalis pallida]RXK47373.1 hypothetical protein EAF64_16470 [Halorientalis pallida]
MVNRRTVLGGVAVAASLAGCILPTPEDEDLVIRNEDASDHRVGVECTRSEETGECYKFEGPVTESLGPGESSQAEEVFSVTDHNYYLLLSVTVDGTVVTETRTDPTWDAVRVVVDGPQEVTVSPSRPVTTSRTSNGTAVNGTDAANTTDVSLETSDRQ